MMWRRCGCLRGPKARAHPTLSNTAQLILSQAKTSRWGREEERVLGRQARPEGQHIVRLRFASMIRDANRQDKRRTQIATG
jgi:hypothetical protein